MAKGFVLDGTNKSIQVTAATNNAQVDYVATWADSTPASFTEGSSDGIITGTAAVNIVSAPASNTRRVIKGLTLYNRGAAAESVTISYNNNSSIRHITTVVLGAGQFWSLDDAVTTTATVTSAASVTTARNLLLNGSFELAQRHNGNDISFTTASTLFKTTHASYLFDRWFTLRQVPTGTLNITQASARNATTTAGVPDLLYGTAIKLNVGGISKFGIAQIIENKNCERLAGQPVTLSFSAKAISTTLGVGNLSAIDYAIISYNGATADVVNRTAMISSWGLAGIVPTLAAGYSYTANTSKPLTTDWQSYSVSAILPSTFKNIGVTIWVNSLTNAITDNLLIKDVQLETGLTATPFEAITESSLLEQCKRYFVSYFPVSFLNTTVAFPGTGSWSGNNFMHTFLLNPTMRITPTYIGSAPSTFKTARYGNYSFLGLSLQPELVKTNAVMLRATRGALTPTTSPAPVGADTLLGITNNAFIAFDAEV